MNHDAIPTRLREHRADLERLGVKSLALFGSAARGESEPDSDVDLLIEFSRAAGLFHCNAGQNRPLRRRNGVRNLPYR